MPQNRRTFLATLGAAALGAACARNGLAAAGRPAPRIGLQLYTVRAAMRENLEATLAAVAGIGYREVEFAGYFGRTPAQIRDALRANGLTAPSTHLGLPEIRANTARVFDDARTAGHSFITVPSLGGADRGAIDNWKRTAATFNTVAAEAGKAGLRFAYHNHDSEFRAVDGIVPFDLLLAETDPSLVTFQLDIYWAVKAGADPLAYLARRPHRFTMTHVKDSAGPPDHRMVDVGAGSIDFARILAAAAEAGVKHHFVEHDQPADAMASIRASYQHLAAILR